MFTFSGLIFILDAVIWILFVNKSWQLKREEPDNKIVQNFLVTFSILAASYLIFSLAIIVLPLSFYTAVILKIVGDFALYLSFSYGTKIPFHLGLPKVNANIPFYIFFAVSVVATICNVIYPPNPLLSNAGIIHWNLNLFTAWGLYPLSLGMWIPTAILFFYQGKNDSSRRERYYIMAVGFVAASFFGPLTVVVKSDAASAFAQLFMTFGHITILLGLLSKAREK